MWVERDDDSEADSPSPAELKLGQLLISSDHFFIFLSILTTFAPELSESHGQK
jgi:hypothetical protein